MKKVCWSRLDTAVMVSMAIMIPALGLSAKSEDGAKPAAARIHSVAALQPAETWRSLPADAVTRLRLSSVSLALR